MGASVFPEHIPWCDRSLQPYPYDPEKALKLLAAAGAEDRDGDGMLELGDRPLVLNAWTYEGRASLRPLLETHTGSVASGRHRHEAEGY